MMVPVTVSSTGGRILVSSTGGRILVSSTGGRILVSSTGGQILVGQQSCAELMRSPARLSLTDLFRIHHTLALCNEYPYIQTSHPPNFPLRAPWFQHRPPKPKRLLLYISRPIDWALAKRYTVTPNPKRLLLYI
jgi:hypothetical protein